MAGLIQHLTFVESLWIEEIAAGGKASHGKRSMQVDPDVSLREAQLGDRYLLCYDGLCSVVTAETIHHALNR